MEITQDITQVFDKALSNEAVSNWEVYKQAVKDGDTYFEINLNEAPEGYGIDCNVYVDAYFKISSGDYFTPPSNDLIITSVDVKITSAWNGGDEVQLTNDEISLLEKKISDLLTKNFQ